MFREVFSRFLTAKAKANAKKKKKFRQKPVNPFIRINRVNFRPTIPHNFPFRIKKARRV